MKKNENYFNSDLNEPKSNILKFNNQKFVIEVAESNNVQILILTNYSDGRIIYDLLNKKSGEKFFFPDFCFMMFMFISNTSQNNPVTFCIK